MNCEDIERLVHQSLLAYLKVEPFDLGCRIVLPQLDVANDFLVVYAIEDKRAIEFTDLGRTMEALRAESLDLETEKRTTILTNILEQNGLKLRGDELVTDVPANNPERFKEKLLLYTNALQSVNAMLHLKQPRFAMDFRGLVRQYLLQRDIRHEYLRSFELPRVGPMTVDFVLQTERPIAIDALHSMERYHATNLIDRTYVKFQFMSRISQPPVRGIVFNDESIIAEVREFPILSEVLDLPPIPWTERESRFSELVGRS